jgi:cysteinyl-tRNA synthetase
MILPFTRFLLQQRRAVFDSLCDDFDTPNAINALEGLVKRCNLYMDRPAAVIPLLLRRVAAYITEIFSVFGLIEQRSDVGFPAGDASAGVDVETVATPFLNVLRDFRSEVRASALAGDAKGVLVSVGRVRDDALPELGVKLEDKAEGTVFRCI